MPSTWPGHLAGTNVPVGRQMFNRKHTNIFVIPNYYCYKEKIKNVLREY